MSHLLKVSRITGSANHLKGIPKTYEFFVFFSKQQKLCSDFRFLRCQKHVVRENMQTQLVIIVILKFTQEQEEKHYLMQ